ncbi:rCG41972 [Rattus norvegicus]|uniref:RCG41972 n=1 Tax=Rattus norvegicus TaxID=10116 RepID=A6JUY9_RAT|nr:rCG41972 [Rattus norvegicus]
MRFLPKSTEKISGGVRNIMSVSVWNTVNPGQPSIWLTCLSWFSLVGSMSSQSPLEARFRQAS